MQTVRLNLHFARVHDLLLMCGRIIWFPQIISQYMCEYKWMNFSPRSICSEAVLHQYKDIDAAFTISPLGMFSQIRFNMKGKKKSFPLLWKCINLHHAFTLFRVLSGSRGENEMHCSEDLTLWIWQGKPDGQFWGNGCCSFSAIDKSSSLYLELWEDHSKEQSKHASKI